MRTVAALLRASWYQARSYRMALVMSVGGLLVAVLPLFFVTKALQPSMAGVISGEADQLFAFVLVGSVALMLVSMSMTALHGAISGGISSGYLESLLMTRASVPSILFGLVSYQALWTLFRCSALIIGGWLIGATIVWSKLLPALFIIAILVLAHFGIGLIAAALVLAFRTAGPLVQIVTTVSAIFGGVYYPVSSIPSWLGVIATLTPLAYGLRALRRVWLQGATLSSVATDLTMIASMGFLAVLIGAIAFQAALKYAKRAGTLGAY